MRGSSPRWGLDNVLPFQRWPVRVPEEDPHRTEFSYLYQRVRQFGFLRCPKKGPNGLIRYWFDAFLRTRTISKPQIPAIFDV